MRFEIYVPEYETETINKMLELKRKRKLSSYIVENMKKETESISRDEIIELIKKYSAQTTNDTSGLEDSINSILNTL